MSLLGKLMSNARKAEIGFGVHENCVILSVSNDQRKNKDGEKVARNCYTVIGQKNDNGDIVAEREISWFNLDPSSDFVYDNFFTQLEQLTNIVDTLNPAGKKDAWADLFDEALEELEISVDLTNEELIEELTTLLKNKKNSAAFMKLLGDGYVQLLEDHVGPESTPRRAKIVYDKNGKYLQQPRYGSIVESMEVEESRLTISSTEEEYKNKNLSATSNKPKPSVTNI